MKVREINRVYFIGVGGIGMSALARFFREQGAKVSGYDRTETPLTKQLATEGIEIHYTDDIQLLDKEAQLVVYTPAIPKDHVEYNWYLNNHYPMFKRSDVLQSITQSMHAITVAGTHGKTTTSTMVAYLLRETKYGCNAFLGGISVNYGRNYWSSKNDTAVIEADEYDRSFLKLSPDIAVLTAIDPDHLDIYGTAEEMEAAFIQYTKNIKIGGTLLVKHGLHRQSDLKGPRTLTYSLQNDAADIYGQNIVQRDGGYVFDVAGEDWKLEGMHLNIGGMHNVENAIAAIAVTQLLGINGEDVRKALTGFKGIGRRFEYVLRNDKIVYIDDYAHHPEELAALIKSAKQLFQGRRCVVCFQPHLFSRTRDFADGFAHSLDMADEVILLDIYPARELPMEGVTSKMIADRMANSAHTILSKEGLLEYIKVAPLDLLITAGAGDIDKLVEPIKNILANK
ncbi:MAG: UDP-N-acetylmuramate--L-alanine ligase [Flavipsychrobacter sp.]|jgi:UDP-N-acetylmuramate--alanine ligase|nr:UDP-N-acetylmuramate--L-alanine ligase [Flavipsychrobacter sp.]